jgi:hypothetical protein
MLILGGLTLGASALAGVAQAGEGHPRILTAIGGLKDARAYLKAAPHNFGGHRAKAIEKIDEALEQLQVCLKY